MKIINHKRFLINSKDALLVISKDLCQRYQKTLTDRQTKMTNTIVSRNAGNEKDLYPGGRKCILSNLFNLIFLKKFTINELLQQHFPLLKNRESYFQLLKQKKSSSRWKKIATGKPPERRVLLSKREGCRMYASS